MPTVLVRAEELFKQIQRRYSIEGFEELCFNFGIEFEAEERGDDGAILYRIEVPANRVDLLCAEGIGRALGVYVGTSKAPCYVLDPETPTVELRVDKSVTAIRPYCFAAMLRGVEFTPERYESFIALQEKLHQNMARKRTLVSMGTHDLSTVKTPLSYTAEDPSRIKFIPLNQTQEVDGHGMVALLQSHPQLKAYLPLISSSPVFPVVRDAQGIVCSVPPVINGEHTKITLDTRDVFIEATALDRTKGLTAINVLCALFSQYCEKPFHIEPVRVIYDEEHSDLPGRVFINPSLEPTAFTTTPEYISGLIGLKGLSCADMCDLLQRMMIDAKPTQANDNAQIIVADVPITRSDVMHPCDLAEDVAVAYGFNRISSTQFQSADEQPYMALSNRIRNLLSICGYHETLTWGLCSLQEGFGFLNHAWTPARKETTAPLTSCCRPYEISVEPVQLSNPKTQEFQMVRTSLLPGLLKALSANQARELPIRLFEIGDVVRADYTTETGASSSRACAALYANSSGSGLEYVHGLLDSLLQKLGLRPVYGRSDKSGSESATNGNPDGTPRNRTESDTPPSATLRKGSSSKTDVKMSDRCYRLELVTEDKAYLSGRCVDVIVEPDGLRIGRMGVFHPEVLRNFKITMPCSAVELTLEPFLKWLPSCRLYDE